jgi:hypothetical protein
VLGTFIVVGATVSGLAALIALLAGSALLVFLEQRALSVAPA